jgi:hypothetical protein
VRESLCDEDDDVREAAGVAFDALSVDPRRIKHKCSFNQFLFLLFEMIATALLVTRCPVVSFFEKSRQSMVCMCVGVDGDIASDAGAVRSRAAAQRTCTCRRTLLYLVRSFVCLLIICGVCLFAFCVCVCVCFFVFFFFFFFLFSCDICFQLVHRSS